MSFKHSTKRANEVEMSIKAQSNYLTLAKRLSDFKIKTYFSQKLLGHLKTNIT